MNTTGVFVTDLFEKALDFIFPIAMLLGVGLLGSIFYGLSNKLHLWLYEGYDREASEAEISFIHTISEKLYDEYEATSDVSLMTKLSPLWILLFCGAGAAGFGYLFYYSYQYIIAETNLRYVDALSVKRLELGVSVFLAPITAFFGMGCLVYQFTKATDKYWKYLALRADIWSWNWQDVHCRHLEFIIHKVRTKKISPTYDFDAEAFLKERVQKNHKIYLIWAGISTFFTILFLILDTSFARVVHADKAISSGHYFNLGQPVIFQPEDMEKVYLHCQYQNKKLAADYRVFIGGKNFATIPVLENNLNTLYKLDQNLRASETEFDPHNHDYRTGVLATDIRYTYCANELAEASSDKEKWLSTLHFYEALDIMEENQKIAMDDRNDQP